MFKVDSHQHFWDPARVDYPWMTDAVAPIRRAFGPADLQPHLAARDIDRTILVQTRSSVEETREFLVLAERTDFIAGVVGWVDLTAPTVAGDLAALRAGAGGTALVGIRHQVHDEPDAGWLTRADVQRGIAAVGAAGLVFDLLVRERELPAALATVEQFPHMRFVLDHIAKPPIASAVLPAGWLGGIAALGTQSNVWCKVSGLVTEADWHAWNENDLRPYVAHIVKAFGLRRLLFGSDWPVCLLAAPYERVHDSLRTILAEYGPEPGDLEPIFGGTASEVYRLKPP